MLFSKDGSILLEYPCAKDGAYTLPETVSFIGEDAFAALLEAAGADGFHGGTNQKYWSSTESSDSNAWYMSFEEGKTSKDEKPGKASNTYFVRPVLAF